MAERRPQTFSNHARFDPLYHFLALPVLFFSSLATVVLFLWRPSWYWAWIFVVAVAAAICILKTRVYALKVQDRVIRLEERLRLVTLLSEPLRSRIPELTEDQLIALRFASDAEIPQLMERAVNEKLSRKEIKKAIKDWRPDYWRV